MEVGGEHYRHVGGVHAIPVAGVAGTLLLCGLEAIGPDPVALMRRTEADTAVCLQTDVEILRRHPAYLDWLASPEPFEALRLPTEDHLVTDDGGVTGLVVDVHGRLAGGGRVVVHCGAGWGRAGVIATLVMCRAGSDVGDALRDLRSARPAAGPQSLEQDDQVRRLGPLLREGGRDPIP